MRSLPVATRRPDSDRRKTVTPPLPCLPAAFRDDVRPAKVREEHKQHSLLLRVPAH
jgi:hypothetical protein